RREGGPRDPIFRRYLRARALTRALGRADGLRCRRCEGTIRRLLVPNRILERRSTSMVGPDTLRYARMPLNDGSGAIPALGFGTLIPDPLATRRATRTALEVGFRHFDCAERYRNEQAVGDAMQEVIK